MRRALDAGMGGIALTDHQSAKNAPAIAECARHAGLACLFGMEVQTAEEVHTIAIFDAIEDALALTEWVYAALPPLKNKPEVFGDQPVVSWDDDIIEMEDKLLAAGCSRSIPETADFVHSHNGLYIAAHIDRSVYSVISGLGMVPQNVFDAVELSRTANAAEWANHTNGYAILRSSDAHHLCDVARVWTEANCDFSISGLKDVFRKHSTKISERLTCFSAN